MSNTEPAGRPPLRIKLSDGSSWPRPAMEFDEYYGVGQRESVYIPMH